MTLTRRSIIRGAGAAGSVLLAGGLPLWARGEQAAGEPAPPDYLRLSSALLGVEAARLEPEARAGEAPLADTFHALCREAAPEATAALLAAWLEAAPRGVATAGPAGPGGAAPAAGEAAGAAAQRLLADGRGPREDGVGALARLTMQMWLCGIWYGGAETTRMPAAAEAIGPAHRTDLVVSVRAYRNGWLWRFAQARPMGVAGAPGAWAEPPPPLAEVLDGA